MSVNIFIVEDEEIYLTDLTILVEEAGYNLVGSTDNADDAFDKIKACDPDVVLVDIALPGLNNGITLSEKINSELHIPHIFTTSFMQENVIDEAVKTNPAGYLKKPIDSGNLIAAIKIALKADVNHQNEPVEKPQILFTKVGDKLHKLEINKICYAQADSDKYTSICIGNKEYACRISLKELQKELPDNFIQIHRSVLVNLNHITEINERNQTINMNGKELPISRRFRKSLNTYLKRI